MSRKIQRVKFHLDSKGIQHLPSEEVKAVLRGADDLIMRGGRTLLVKILKGSRSKDVMGQDLDQSPVYGYYQGLSNEDVLARVDWVIRNGYLTIEYDRRLPLLVYTDQGWAIEKETYANELLQKFDQALAASPHPIDMTFLKDRNRSIIWLLLDRIAASGDTRYIPLLEAWERIDYKKVRQRIREVIQTLSGPPGIATKI
jgi:hypothetical protein